MRQKPERWAAYAGVLAVVLWIVGILVQESGNTPSEGAADAEYLTHIQDDANSILTGGWIFMVGCLAFLVFAIVLRDRLAEAEGGSRLYTNIAFVGAVAVGAFGLLLPGSEIAAAISSDDISASTAAALSTLSDGFFVAAELAAILLMLGTGVIALRTALLPKWWGWFSFLLAVVLLIGPIGWAGLIFGLPVWVLVTTFFLVRRETPAPRPVALGSN
jgi:hypothetical protein